MATIFEKLPASGEKCLILDPREALYYPFDIDSDWVEIRMTAAFSITTSSNDNALYTPETSAWSHLNMLAGGFFYGPVGSRPSQEGVNFIGQRSYDALTASNAINASAYMGGVYGGLYAYNNSTVSGTSTNTSNSASWVLPTASEATGTSLYMRYKTWRLTINNNVFNISTDNSTAAANLTNDGSLRKARTLLLNYSPNLSHSGPWRTSLSATGDPLPKPNMVYFWFPWVNNRVRIHNILVEKIS